MKKSFLKENLELLVERKSLDRHEAVLIFNSSELPENYTVETSRKNPDVDTLFYTADEKKHYFHSSFAPVDEAHRKAARLAPSLNRVSITGIGLGYETVCILRTLKNLEAIMIIEKEPHLLAALLSCFSLKDYSGIEWFIWCGDVSSANLERFDKFTAALEPGKFEIIVNPAFEKANPMFSERMKHTLRMRQHMDVVEVLMSRSVDEASFLPSLRSYFEQRLYEVPFPVIIRIEPTNFCNLKCRMCPSTNYPKSEKGFMSLDLYKQILDELAANAPDRVYHIVLYLGGEPLMHRKIADMVRMAHERGYLTQINTNATLLKEDISRRLIDAGLDLVLFSFDDVPAERYGEMRVGAVKDKVYENIINFLELKEAAKTAHPLTHIASLQYPSECDPQPRPASPVPSEELKRLFEGRNVQFIMNWAHHWASDFTADVQGMPPLGALGPYFPCRLLWGEMTIRWDGTVVPCCYDLRSEEVISRFPDQSLAEIWNGEHYTGLRQSHVRGRAGRIPLCAGCSGLRGGEIFAGFLGDAAEIYRKQPV